MPSNKETKPNFEKLVISNDTRDRRKCSARLDIISQFQNWLITLAAEGGHYFQRDKFNKAVTLFYLFPKVRFLFSYNERISVDKKDYWRERKEVIVREGDEETEHSIEKKKKKEKSREERRLRDRENDKYWEKKIIIYSWT